jgi:uncharacterized protein YlbG (UPF0298 family)
MYIITTTKRKNMKANNFAMKDWHLEHIEKVIIRFVQGLPADASSFEKRNYKRYGTVSNCIRQIEYDLKHGVEKEEVTKILHKIKRDKKYREVRLHPDAMVRLKDLENRLSGGKVENLLWYDQAFRDRNTSGHY